MTWIEVLWWLFWRVLDSRSHESPRSPSGLFPLAASTAPARCRTAWKETACGSTKQREPQHCSLPKEK